MSQQPTGGMNHPEVIPEILREYARNELRGLPTAALGRLTTLDTETRRATVEIAPDGNTIDNVPVATPYAGDDAGDIVPLDPASRDAPIHGLVVFTHHSVTDYLAAGGVTGGEWDHTEEHAVFLPAMVWTDHDTVPDHDANERVIAHPSGATVSMDGETITVGHPMGLELEFGGLDAEDETFPPGVDDSFHAEEEQYTPGELDPPETDNTTFPPDNDGDAYARLSHPVGVDITLTDRGVAITDGDDDGNAVQSIVSGTPTDGGRRVLDGRYQHGHFIPDTDADGDEHYLYAPNQRPFREWIARLTDPELVGRISNAHTDAVRDARTFAENYLAWLEAELGESVDPTDADAWPDPEPMPTAAELDAFEPVHARPRAGAATVAVGATSPRVIAAPRDAVQTASGVVAVGGEPPSVDGED